MRSKFVTFQTICLFDFLIPFWEIPAGSQVRCRRKPRYLDPKNKTTESNLCRGLILNFILMMGLACN